MIKSSSPGLGIALKISDGDINGRARPAVSLEILRSLGAITSDQLDELSDFGPKFQIKNWRNIIVGEAHSTFSIQVEGLKS